MTEARWAVLATGLLAMVAASLAGVLPVVLLPVAAVLLTSCALGAARADERTAGVLRHTSNGLALAAVALTVPGLLAQGSEGLRGELGPLLVCVQVAQALTWRTRRDLQLGLGVAVALMVLAGSYAPDVLVGLPLVGGWAAGVAALVLLAGARTAEGADATATDRSGRVRSPVVPATCLALATGLVAFLVLPFGEEADARGGLGSSAAQALSARSAVFSGDRIDLRTRGELGEQVLAEVPDDGTQLWRSASYSSWDGTGWSSPELRESFLAGPPPFLVPGAPGGPRTRSTVELERGRGTVWSPGLPVSVQAEAPALRLDSSGAVRLPRSVSSYVVEAAPLKSRPDVLRAADAGPADPRWLQLPDRLPQRVRDLAQEITADAPTTYDKVVAVEQWLAANATYRLDSPVPGPDEDAVDRFLFVDRTGFCEQFAAAEAVLLRAVGIPTRLVVGLAYGESAGAGRRLFRENMLHAWVEVSYEQVGWAASDPTAGAAQAAVTPSVRSRLAAQVNSAIAAVGSAPGGDAVLVGAVLLSALAISRLLGRPRRRRRGAGPAPDGGASPAGPAAARRPALAAFLRWDARLGDDRGRRSSETLVDLRRRLDLPPAEVAALSVVEQECYAAVSPSSEDTDRAVRVLDPP